MGLGVPSLGVSWIGPSSGNRKSLSILFVTPSGSFLLFVLFGNIRSPDSTGSRQARQALASFSKVLSCKFLGRGSVGLMENGLGRLERAVDPCPRSQLEAPNAFVGGVGVVVIANARRRVQDPTLLIWKGS